MEALAQEPRDHLVQFYACDDDLTAAVAPSVGAALAGHETAIVIATPAHRAAFWRACVAAGHDLAADVAEGRLLMLDAAETMAGFIADGRPEPFAFDRVVGGLVHRATGSGRPVRAYGEMVALLWDAGNIPAAVELEGLWNDLRREVEFTLLCAYPTSIVEGDHHLDALNEMCRLHSAVTWERASISEPATKRSGALEAARTFVGNRLAPRDARHFVVEELERLGHPDLAEDAAIVVAELAANAVLHACSDFEVALSTGEDCIRIAVRDRSPLSPAQRRLESQKTSGRGLRIVAGVATGWGTELVDDGKVVWAELNR